MIFTAIHYNIRANHSTKNNIFRNSLHEYNWQSSIPAISFMIFYVVRWVRCEVLPYINQPMNTILIILLTVSICLNIAVIAFLFIRKEQNSDNMSQVNFTNTVSIGKVDNVTKDESNILKWNHNILSIIVKLIDFKVAYYADNFVRTEATDAEMRIYQWYINALVAFRWQLANLIEEWKKK